MHLQPKLGVIGGSGLYHISGLQNVQEQVVETPFGDPSVLVVVELALRWLFWRGIGHLFQAEVNYGNIYALKALGRANHRITCGSLRDDYALATSSFLTSSFDLDPRNLLLWWGWWSLAWQIHFAASFPAS
jgi:purine nucleoside phosphorylase